MHIRISTLACLACRLLCDPNRAPPIELMRRCRGSNDTGPASLNPRCRLSAASAAAVITAVNIILHSIWRPGKRDLDRRQPDSGRLLTQRGAADAGFSTDGVRHIRVMCQSRTTDRTVSTVIYANRMQSSGRQKVISTRVRRVCGRCSLGRKMRRQMAVRKQPPQLPVS